MSEWRNGEEEATRIGVEELSCGPHCTSPKYVMASGWTGDADDTFDGLQDTLKRYLQSAWAGYANFGRCADGEGGGGRRMGLRDIVGFFFVSEWVGSRSQRLIRAHLCVQRHWRLPHAKGAHRRPLSALGPAWLALQWGAE